MSSRGCPRIRSVYTVEDVDKLRDSTPIGSEIKFKMTLQTYSSAPINRTVISGIVTAKYDHVFVLDDEYTYDWKQYLLGKID